jgi:hypothetical protein
MRHRSIAVTLTLTLVAAVPGRTQSPHSKGDSFRTPWGSPDLQGTWTGSTLTPLERPAEFAGKAVLTGS